VITKIGAQLHLLLEFWVREIICRRPRKPGYTTYCTTSHPIWKLQWYFVPLCIFIKHVYSFVSMVSQNTYNSQIISKMSYLSNQLEWHISNCILSVVPQETRWQRRHPLKQNWPTCGRRGMWLGAPVTWIIVVTQFNKYIIIGPQNPTWQIY